MEHVAPLDNILKKEIRSYNVILKYKVKNTRIEIHENPLKLCAEKLSIKGYSCTNKVIKRIKVI